MLKYVFAITRYQERLYFAIKQLRTLYPQRRYFFQRSTFPVFNIKKIKTGTVFIAKRKQKNMYFLNVQILNSIFTFQKA